MVAYLRRAIGYSMTGNTIEHLFFMLYGNGTNGKSTFIEAIRNVFGDYAKASAFTTFMQQQSPSAPRNDLAALAGAYTGSVLTSKGGQQTATASVSPTGAITGSAQGCNFTDTATPRTDANLFTLSVTFAGAPCYFANQTVSGAVYFDAANSRVYGAAPNADRSDAVLFVGTKP